MAARLTAVLPTKWFGDAAPLAQAVLQGIGTAWATIYTMIQFVRDQTRIGSATGEFLDLISADFFGISLPRRLQEADSAFLLRIQQEMLRPRATRSALALALLELTGNSPAIFEPARASDTGGYATGGVGYGVAGGWGNLTLPYQVFVEVRRPQGGGIAALAGYGTGGYLVYGALSLVQTPVTDADIYAEIAAVLPAATIAWSRIVG